MVLYVAVTAAVIDCHHLLGPLNSQIVAIDCYNLNALKLPFFKRKVQVSSLGGKGERWLQGEEARKTAVELSTIHAAWKGTLGMILPKWSNQTGFGNDHITVEENPGILYTCSRKPLLQFRCQTRAKLPWGSSHTMNTDFFFCPLFSLIKRICIALKLYKKL